MFQLQFLKMRGGSSLCDTTLFVCSGTVIASLCLRASALLCNSSVPYANTQKILYSCLLYIHAHVTVQLYSILLNHGNIKSLKYGCIVINMVETFVIATVLWSQSRKEPHHFGRASSTLNVLNKLIIKNVTK
jgi:hypothetical protein